MLHFEDWGAGPTVLLLHGAPSTTEDFAPLVDDLSRDHRVLVPELPGYGRSPNTHPYTVERVQALLESGLGERGIAELAIVGFSYGAHLALRLAASTGLAVRSVVCIGGFASLTPVDREQTRQLADFLSAPGATLRSPEFGALARQRFLAPRFASDEAMGRKIDRWLDVTQAHVLADQLIGMIEADARAFLPDLPMPVTARVGALDIAAPRHYSEEIARTCRRGRLEVVEDHGHALLVEQPGETTKAVRAALCAN